MYMTDDCLCNGGKLNQMLVANQHLILSALLDVCHSDLRHMSGSPSIALHPSPPVIPDCVNP